MIGETKNLNSTYAEAMRAKGRRELYVRLAKEYRRNAANTRYMQIDRDNWRQAAKDCLCRALEWNQSYEHLKQYI